MLTLLTYNCTGFCTGLSLFVACVWGCPLGSAAAWTTADDGEHLWLISNQRESEIASLAWFLTCSVVPGTLTLRFLLPGFCLTWVSDPGSRIAAFPPKEGLVSVHPAVPPPEGFWLLNFKWTLFFLLSERSVFPYPIKGFLLMERPLISVL